MKALIVLFLIGLSSCATVEVTTVPCVIKVRDIQGSRVYDCDPSTQAKRQFP